MVNILTKIWWIASSSSSSSPTVNHYRFQHRTLLKCSIENLRLNLLKIVDALEMIARCVLWLCLNVGGRWQMMCPAIIIAQLLWWNAITNEFFPLVCRSPYAFMNNAWFKSILLSYSICGMNWMNINKLIHQMRMWVRVCVCTLTHPLTPNKI